MKLTTALFFALVISTASRATPNDSVIYLTSDTWHKLTMPDGNGLYFDLIRAVFEPVGIKVSIDIVPYARSVVLVETKKADGWVASFMNEQPFPIYPKWHFDRNRQVAVSLKSTVPPFKDLESLKGKPLIWLRDFNLDKYIPFPVNFEEIDAVSNAFLMLTAKRATYFIGAESDVMSAVKAEKIDVSKFRFDFLMHLELYVAFANTERGKRFKAIWDSRMEKLSKDPKFRAIYTRYGYPIPF